MTVKEKDSMNEATQLAPVQIGAAGTVEDMNAPLDLTDFAEEAGGALNPGWYRASIIGGYATQRGKQIVTGDTLSSKGDSHNLKVCFHLTQPNRNLFNSFNYRTSDFTADRLAQIKALREQFAGTQGAWPGQSDAQRSSLAIADLSQFQKAVGMSIPRNNGILNASPLVGQSLDVRVGVDKKGYNEITAYATLGKRTKA